VNVLGDGKADDEVKRLRRCINDLVVVLTLPAMWTARDPSHIANTLLDVLVKMLRLDFAYIHLSEAVGGLATEWARSITRPDVDPHEVGRALDGWLTGETTDTHVAVPNPVGDGVMSAASFRLGLQDEVGRFVAGSQRPDFPTDVEHLLMRVAANEAAVGLQEARYARQQRHATDDLERRVGERTAELENVNERFRKEILERQRATRLNRDLAGRLIASQEAERQRIARELHDDVSQKLALLNNDVDQMASRFGEGEFRERLQEISGRAGEIATDLHNLSYELHPSKLQTLGLSAALQSLCRDLSQQSGLDVAFTYDVLPQEVDPNVSLCLYRIAQEALHNVLRHSHAEAAQVRLKREGDSLALRVADAGDGFDPHAQHNGLGLVSMSERVAFLNGQLSIDSAPGRGTRIDVRVPVPPSGSAASTLTRTSA
jgi:signal transduction histidine kinase